MAKGKEALSVGPHKAGAAEAILSGAALDGMMLPGRPSRIV